MCISNIQYTTYSIQYTIDSIQYKDDNSEIINKW